VNVNVFSKSPGDALEAMKETALKLKIGPENGRWNRSKLPKSTQHLGSVEDRKN